MTLRGTIRLLAVDENCDRLLHLCLQLSGAPLTITPANRESEALEALENASYDLVVADLMQPAMGGAALTKAIRRRFTPSELPVLLLVSPADPEHMLTGFEAGANDCIEKPADPSVLRAKIQAWTEMKNAALDRLEWETAWHHAHLQPHFLYNTLNSISALSTIDACKLQALVEAFGHYLRLCIDLQQEHRVIALERELELVRSYLYIEKERFGDRLQVEWELDPDVRTMLPPLTLLPLVENAVRHGLMRRTSGGTLQIRVAGDDRFGEISVQDDGVGMSVDRWREILEQGGRSAKSGVGLLTADRRLRQLFGTGLDIHSVPDHGTTVKFRVRTLP